MAGHRNFNELRARMSLPRRQRNERAVQKELRRMLLAELRHLAGATQSALAASIGVKQPTLSQLESQSDMQISTLRRIVEALGGELEIIATLPTGRVALSQFEQKKRRRKSA
jgi:transcriptional regulator with XRE-family HTH domain